MISSIISNGIRATYGRKWDNVGSTVRNPKTLAIEKIITQKLFSI